MNTRLPRIAFAAAFKQSPRALGATVVGFCMALAALVGCKGPASVAEARKSGSGPVRKHPENPHYFHYKGKPLVLISTDQHYGAVINLDFDYLPFLDRLHEYGMNLTVLSDPERRVAICAAECANNAGIAGLAEGCDELKNLAVVGNAAHRNPLLVKALEKQFGLSCRVIASGGEAALGVARLVAHLNTGEPPCT